MSKKQPKLTDWFPGEVRPARVGVYERKSYTGLHSFWNGRYWGLGFNLKDSTPKQIEHTKTKASMCQGHQWRGLAEKPS